MWNGGVYVRERVRIYSQPGLPGHITQSYCVPTEVLQKKKNKKKKGEKETVNTRAQVHKGRFQPSGSGTPVLPCPVGRACFKHKSYSTKGKTGFKL